LISGVGRSGVVSTCDAYQVPYDQSRERCSEILDIANAAWRAPKFSSVGKHHSFKGIACVPHPYRNKLPEIRVAASTPDRFAAIGGICYPVFASTRHSTWSDVVGQVASYQAGWKISGREGRCRAFVAGRMYSTDTERRARDEARESVELKISTSCNTR
jgi:alkanesulfonate monooxygenase SsuD/methylene tetrahydromethanopterin reductase-like flavin-dependent oxidoreductase (luciferase family)